jgi:hypothetical protein
MKPLREIDCSNAAAIRKIVPDLYRMEKVSAKYVGLTRKTSRVDTFAERKQVPQIY